MVIVWDVLLRPLSKLLVYLEPEKLSHITKDWRETLKGDTSDIIRQMLRKFSMCCWAANSIVLCVGQWSLFSEASSLSHHHHTQLISGKLACRCWFSPLLLWVATAWMVSNQKQFWGCVGFRHLSQESQRGPDFLPRWDGEASLLRVQTSFGKLLLSKGWGLCSCSLSSAHGCTRFLALLDAFAGIPANSLRLWSYMRS
jgi:hypothetical protein